MTYLHFFLDHKKCPTKTIVNILKKFLSRDLALQFTAQKLCPGKKIMKGTSFCKFIIGENC